MRGTDALSFAFHALFSVRLRAFLMLLAMAIGVAAVIILISLGESARTYVVSRFANLGTNLLFVIPGRSETTGGIPPLVGETPQDLTITDALALLRHPTITKLAPVVVGSAPVSYQQREREVMIFGTTAPFLHIVNLSMGRGSFLSTRDPYRAQQVCVLGKKLAAELFGTSNVLGKIIRIGDRRFQVIGSLAESGVSIGMDTDDMAFIPVASAMALFNTESLFRIMIEAQDRDAIGRLKKQITRTMKERHNGEEDITIITQDAILATFDRIFDALTLTVSGIAAISLLVAGILVMNVMLVSVSQRTREIGLLKALGAPSSQIMSLFLLEAFLLSLLGACIGTALGLGANELLSRILPDFTFESPLWSIGAALLVAICTGLLFAALPARRAAQLEPVEALSKR